MDISYKTKGLFLGIIVTLFLYSCGGGDKSTVTEKDVDKMIEQEIALDSSLRAVGAHEKLDYIIENLQTSDNLIRVLSSNTNIFSDGILNDVNKVNEYELAREKALNLGIYGADLNYLIHFGQTQSSFMYLVVSKQLADEIGVAMAFDQQVIDEYQANTENKDTLLNIIFTAYQDVKKLLKNNEQFQLSTLVIAGSWIENMFVTTELLPLSTDETQKENIFKDLHDQKDYLAKITELLHILNTDNNSYVNMVLGEFKCIDSVYTKMGDTCNYESITELNSKLEMVRNNLSLNN